MEKGGEVCVFNGNGGRSRAAEMEGMGLAYVGGQAGSDKSADLPRRPKSDGATRRRCDRGMGEQEKNFRPASPSPRRPVAPSPRRPSLLGRTYRGLRGGAGLSH